MSFYQETYACLWLKAHSLTHIKTLFLFFKVLLSLTFSGKAFQMIHAAFLTTSGLSNSVAQLPSQNNGLLETEDNRFSF